jgi:hypothetical protein
VGAGPRAPAADGGPTWEPRIAEPLLDGVEAWGGPGDGDDAPGGVTGTGGDGTDGAGRDCSHTTHTAANSSFQVSQYPHRHPVVMVFLAYASTVGHTGRR